MQPNSPNITLFSLVLLQASQHPNQLPSPNTGGGPASSAALAPTVAGLTWDCSAEFEATVGQPVSFVERDAFISFPNWISRTGAMVGFDVSSIECGAYLRQIRPV